MLKTASGIWLPGHDQRGDTTQDAHTAEVNGKWILGVREKRVNGGI